MSTSNKLDGKRKQPEDEPDNKEDDASTTVPAFLLKIYDILKVP